jgi:trehalose 2-sulfotransferase
MAAVAPTTSYLICSTPRSGTTLLCEALRNTGVAGQPEEYFQEWIGTGTLRGPHDYFADAGPELLELVSACAAPVESFPLVDPSRFETWAGYFDWVMAHGTTANGLFGAKVMWAYLPGLLNRLAAHVPGCAAARDGVELLDRALPDLRYVFVTREHKAAQAVSLWRALQTWRWRGTDPGGREEQRTLCFSFEAIDHLVNQLTEDEGSWRDWFERHGIEPLTVVYEDLAAACEETTRSILRHVGVPPQLELRLGKPRIPRQADDLSREWVDRYTAELDARVRL